MKPILIETEDLCKTYTSDKVPFHALRNVNLQITQGEFTVIMGSSGSGKSTLLYLLSGLDTVTAGRVHMNGQRIDLLTEKKAARFRRTSIGFVFQAINLVPTLSLQDNIALSGYVNGGNRRNVASRTMQLIREMDLEESAGRLPSQVSGGQQQRAAIARALINQPEVLYADEPTGSLNSTQGKNVLNVLTEINRKGQTVVMVTHDLRAACRASRILFIRDGRIDGDMKLPPFREQDQESRESKVFAFLSEKGW